MSLHVSIFHPAATSNAAPVYTLGTPLTLEQEMHCVCGFATASGKFLVFAFFAQIIPIFLRQQACEAPGQ